MTEGLPRPVSTEPERLALSAALRYIERNTPQLVRDEISTLVSERDALAVRVRELEGDAKRWGQVRQHWKKANFSWHKTPANNIKSVTLVIDFDHLSPNGAAMIEREFDAAITTTSGDSHE